MLLLNTQKKNEKDENERNKYNKILLKYKKQYENEINLINEQYNKNKIKIEKQYKIKLNRYNNLKKEKYLKNEKDKNTKNKYNQIMTNNNLKYKKNLNLIKYQYDNIIKVIEKMTKEKLNILINKKNKDQIEKNKYISILMKYKKEYNEKLNIINIEYNKEIEIIKNKTKIKLQQISNTHYFFIGSQYNQFGTGRTKKVDKLTQSETVPFNNITVGNKYCIYNNNNYESLWSSGRNN